MRIIDTIVVHCSATRPTMDIGADEIRNWHVNDNGWNDIGYHYVIRRNGMIEKGRNESVVGAHAKGYNANSIGICLVGGITRSGKSDANFDFNQYTSLRTLIDDIRQRYEIGATFGHRDISEKDCPCFDVCSILE